MFTIGPGLDHPGANRRSDGVVFAQRLPAVGERLRTGGSRIGTHRGDDVAIEILPGRRWPVIVIVLPLRPGLVAVVLPHHLDVLHAHDSDDVLQDDRRWRTVSHRLAFGVGECPDGPVQEPPLLLEHVALLAEDRRQWERLAVEQRADILQRKSNGLERENLLEPDEISRRIDAIARVRPAWPKQADAIVVMERLDRDAGQFGEFVNAIARVVPHQLRL